MTAAAYAPLRLPPQPAGRGAGWLLSLLIHAVLAVALATSVDWRRAPDAVFSAELWAALPQQAAPPPAPVEPATPRPPVEATPPQPAAQIAIEKAEREKRLRDEQQAREAEREKRLKAEKARKEEEARQQAEEEKRLTRQREENLKRMLGQAGSASTATTGGNAARDAAPSAAYAGRIKAKIKPNIVFNDAVPGNPEAEVEVRCAPDGTIVGKKIVRSSGLKAWDDAVLRAIDKTETLPRDVDGRMPATLNVVFRLRD